MKIAISGKGGVGKTLLSASLSHTFARAGYPVIAIDADPDANLAATLGYPPTPKKSPPSRKCPTSSRSAPACARGKAAPCLT
ncbi:MAG: AAA family ATPase [Chloroflexota bacterium]